MPIKTVRSDENKFNPENHNYSLKSDNHHRPILQNLFRKVNNYITRRNIPMVDFKKESVQVKRVDQLRGRCVRIGHDMD